MAQVKIFDTIFAVMDESNKDSAVLIGTAFSIGEGVFATAGHVAEAIQTAKRPTLRQFKTDGTAGDKRVTGDKRVRS